MAELYRHTDEAGDTFAVLSVDTVVGLIVLVRRGVAVRGAVEVSDVDGRRLLDALLSYYGSRSEEITKEEDDHA